MVTTKGLECLFRKHYHDMDHNWVGHRNNYFGCSNELLKKVKESGLDEKVLLSLPHPEFLPELGYQSNDSSCGTHSLRTVLLLSYGYRMKESTLWAINEEIKKDDGFIRYVKDRAEAKKGAGIVQGIEPKRIAKIADYVGKHYLGKKLVVYEHFDGKINHIRHFLDLGLVPIIHRSFAKINGEPYGKHYETIIGMEGDNKTGRIYLYNSFHPRYYEAAIEDGLTDFLQNTKGLHSMTNRKFIRSWWPFYFDPDTKIDKVKWFMIIAPEDLAMKNFKDLWKRKI